MEREAVDIMGKMKNRINSENEKNSENEIKSQSNNSKKMLGKKGDDEKNKNSSVKNDNRKNNNEETENGGQTHHRHDKGYKRIFGIKKNFLDFIKKYVALDWMMNLTEDDLEIVNKEFITEEFETFESDIIYKINVHGQEIYLYFQQEMQSGNDFTMPFRLLVYMTLIWLDFFKNSDKNERTTKEFRFPPIIPLVLYNGRDAWTAKRHFKEVVNESEMFNGYVADFEYLLVDVKRLEKEFILNSNKLVDNVLMMDHAKTKDDLKEALRILHSRIMELDYSDQSEWYIWFRKVFGTGKNSKEIENLIRYFKNGDEEGMSTGVDLIIEDEKKQAMELGMELGRESGIILTKKVFKLSKEGKIISEIARECEVSEETVRDILE